MSLVTLIAHKNPVSFEEKTVSSACCPLYVVWVAKNEDRDS